MNAKSMFRASMIGCAFAAAFASGAVMAQSTTADQTVAGHPRINEVNQRLANQQKRTDNGVADGQINAKQEARDTKQDANIAQRESADEAKHNGHLTKREKHNLNKSENHDSKRIRKQRQG